MTVLKIVIIKNFWNSNINLKVVSFIPQDRFFRKINFEERSLKIIATGSFHNLYEEKPPEYYEDF